MANFLNDLLEAAGTEKILALKLLGPRHPSYMERHDQAAPIVGKLVSLSEAYPYLNYEYDDGYGGQDCHDIHAWTPTRVLSIHEYDGSTWFISVPRDPE